MTCMLVEEDRQAERQQRDDNVETDRKHNAVIFYTLRLSVCLCCAA